MDINALFGSFLWNHDATLKYETKGLLYKHAHESVVEASNVINALNVIKVPNVITFGPKCNKGPKCNNFWP